MDRISLIVFNDDNHAERLFINGHYIGTLNDIGNIIKNVIDIARDLNDTYKFTQTTVYVCDDFDDYEEDDEIIDRIWEFFNNTKEMTEKQVELIEDKNWEELNKII